MRARAVLLALVLAGCGYHLVGANAGRPQALPAGTQTVQLLGEGQLVALLRTRLAEHGIAVREDAAITVRIAPPKAKMQPIAYDAAGRPQQYRLVLSAQVTVERVGEILWTSGSVSVAETLLLAEEPASLEAAVATEREQLLQRLADALWRRLATGW